MPNNNASGVSSLTSASVVPTERVSIRIPEFTLDDPELWFCILERNLVTAGITLDGVKASNVTGALGPRAHPSPERFSGAESPEAPRARGNRRSPTVPVPPASASSGRDLRIRAASANPLAGASPEQCTSDSGDTARYDAGQGG
ncbi:hypothetical protein ANTRET_LOCUS10810 [Anthophora retusa]